MSRLENIKNFFKNHQDKFILTIGFILVCAISFAAGRISVISKSEPLEIDESNILENTNSKEDIKAEEPKEENKDTTPISKKEENEGVFVGNIENNKFYPFNSEEVGNIPEDNKMWFDSKEEAEEQGYVMTNTNTKTIESEKTNTDSNKDIKSENSETCQYVGSKNSDKYHLPDSGSAKRIKEENKVCFKSKEDAEGQGYTAGSGVTNTEEKE
jgi:hypothetical protein